MIFFAKKVVFDEVGLMVFDGGESESTSHFSKFVNSRITVWDVNLVNNVSLSTRSNPFCFRIELSEAHGADALLLVKYFSTPFRSIFIVFVGYYR